MPKQSAGLLMYRLRGEKLQVFLVHPGGPFWVNKDAGAWTIPKGEVSDGEEALAAARREFSEETGFSADGPFLELGAVKQGSGKIVTAWAFAGDGEPADLKSNHCSIEWPPRSGRRMDIPEVDRGDWFEVARARVQILSSQLPFLDRLGAQLLPAEMHSP